GLPQSPNNFLADYTFTEVDAGRHVFPDFSFNGHGQHTITVIDRNYTSRWVTTNPVTVTDVTLVATITPTTAIAGIQSLTLTIEALDPNGDLVPGYRGALDINPTTSTSGLPQSATHFHPDYVFTEADGGRHVFPNFSFNNGGEHTITVIDRSNSSHQDTSNSVEVAGIHFQVTMIPTTTYAGVQDLALTVEVLDENDQRVTDYRGGIDFSASAPVWGLPSSSSSFYHDYTFTHADAGIHTFTGLGFATPGNQNVTVS